MTIEVDIAILGGGPAGYSAAIRAAQLGKRTVVVERDKVGGTCLHRGCIPSKALLRSAEILHTVKEAGRFGVALEASSVVLQFRQVQARKAQAVEQLYRGLNFLMKKHGIEVLHGNARVIGPSIFSPRSGALAVELADGEMETVVSKNLILATGSRPRSLPGLEPDGLYLLTSDHMLELEELPASLLIIGGGVIGVEWASMMNDFGVEVTLVEASSRLLPGEDADISGEMERVLRKRGVRVLTSVSLATDSLRVEGDEVSLAAETADGKVVLSASKVLLSIGRAANTEGLGLENTDIQLHNGFIRVNERLQTTEPHIYAAGDVTGGIQLAHAAAHEGILAVEHCAGLQPQPLDPLQVSRCIYSRPEIASIGLSEHEARDRGYKVRLGRMPFQAIGKAIVLGETDGFVKVIADEATEDVLGVHLIGPHATDLIAEAALGQLLNASHLEIGQAIHPHPTLSEAIGEAMLAVTGRSMAM